MENNTTPVEKELSIKSVGMGTQATPVYTIKGVKQRGRLSKIIIDIEDNTIETLWRREYFDNEGGLLDVSTKIEKVFVRDMPEKGVAEINQKTKKPNMSTYIKTDEENLQVTNWVGKLGKIVFLPAKAMISKIIKN